MLRNVAAVALQGVAPFELGVICEVFAIDRSAQGLPTYDFALVAGEPGPLRTSAGFTIDTAYGLDRLDEADLVCVPAAPHEREMPADLLAALRRTVDRGARVMSVCSGAFVLGAAGLLDGRRCTTHWMHSDELARRFPAAKVDPDVLYVDDGDVLTSAGTAAGIDLCLHIVRQEQGAAVANAIARRMVVPPHRDGGQAQFVETPVPEADRGHALESLLVWVMRNLDAEITVESLAALAHMSPRTFARRFRAEIGTTPHRWITGQRIALAQRLLEETDETVDVIAARTGFGNAATLRHHFARALRTTPQAYRRCFRDCSDPGEALSA
jgi:transcriptional regulator GlxA family with amidase domain